MLAVATRGLATGMILLNEKRKTMTSSFSWPHHYQRHQCPASRLAPRPLTSIPPCQTTSLLLSFVSFAVLPLPLPPFFFLVRISRVVLTCAISFFLVGESCGIVFVWAGEWWGRCWWWWRCGQIKQAACIPLSLPHVLDQRPSSFRQ